GPLSPTTVDGLPMIFLSLIVVLLLVQWWGSGAPLQYDAWFARWSDTLKSIRLLHNAPTLYLLFSVAVPALVLALLIYTIGRLRSVYWLFCIHVPLLRPSLRRRNYDAEVNAYKDAMVGNGAGDGGKQTDKIRMGGFAAGPGPTVDARL